jgi:hypothetical protein
MLLFSFLLRRKKKKVTKKEKPRFSLRGGQAYACWGYSVLATLEHKGACKLASLKHASLFFYHATI